MYRASNLKLPAGAQIAGTRGSTTLVLSQAGASLISAVGSDHITFSGLILDGGHKPLPDRKGLVQLENCKNVGVSVAPGAGTALIANNLISEESARRRDRWNARGNAGDR